MPFSQECIQHIQFLLNAAYFNEQQYDRFFNEDNVNDVLFDGWTPLTLSIDCQNSLALQYFIDLGADVDKPGPEKRTALELAILKNEHEMVDILIKNHARIPLRIDDYSMLCIAISNKMVTLVHKLVEDLKANVNEEDIVSHTTPLITAAEVGNLEIVKLLVREKAKVNFLPRSGITAIAAAAIHQHLPIVKFLLHQGADVALAKQSIKSRLEDILKMDLDDIEEEISRLRSGFELLIETVRANDPSKLSKSQFEFFNAKAHTNTLRSPTLIPPAGAKDSKSGA